MPYQYRREPLSDNEEKGMALGRRKLGDPNFHILIKGLMGNKNRTNVAINIISKGKREQLDDLKLRFKHLAGEVSFIGNDGFLDYIKSSGL